MPVHKAPGGYKWGDTGKVYPTKAQAEVQGRAIYASGNKEKTNQQEEINPPKTTPKALLISLLTPGLIKPLGQGLKVKLGGFLE